MVGIWHAVNHLILRCRRFRSQWILFPIILAASDNSAAQTARAFDAGYFSVTDPSARFEGETSPALDLGALSVRHAHSLSPWLAVEGTLGNRASIHGLFGYHRADLSLESQGDETGDSIEAGLARVGAEVRIVANQYVRADWLREAGGSEGRRADFFRVGWSQIF